ncbi:MAG TPA: helix-turn-helix transcriptional regulator [Solirubrobacterales bacterium]|nr:helix-turn-helix transcriptional regulator [Solirubrobacterales bacterium]
MDIATRFGENLKRCRRRAELSQEELAIRASLHRTQIGLLERGSRQPRIDTLVKLAGALGIEPGDLLEGIEWSPGSSSVGGFSVAAGDPRSN